MDVLTSWYYGNLANESITLEFRIDLLGALNRAKFSAHSPIEFEEPYPNSVWTWLKFQKKDQKRPKIPKITGNIQRRKKQNFVKRTSNKFLLFSDPEPEIDRNYRTYPNFQFPYPTSSNFFPNCPSNSSGFFGAQPVFGRAIRSKISLR